MNIVQYFAFSAIGVFMIAMFHTVEPIVNIIEDSGLNATETFVASIVLLLSFITVAFVWRASR